MVALTYEIDPEFIKKAIDLRSCNALLLKVNQIGTLTESIQAAKDAFGAGWGKSNLFCRSPTCQYGIEAVD